jgi:acid phosphatase family membrane protein YuiD
MNSILSNVNPRVIKVKVKVILEQVMDAQRVIEDGSTPSLTSALDAVCGQRFTPGEDPLHNV